jgi:GTP-binding protein HflX
VDLLSQAIAEYFGTDRLRRLVRLGPADGWRRAWFFNHAQVLAEAHTEQGGWVLEVRVPRLDLERLLSRDPALGDHLSEPKAEVAAPVAA